MVQQVISCRDHKFLVQDWVGQTGHQRWILMLSHSFIHSANIYTESLLSARLCAQCLEYINEQKEQGLGSSWRSQSSRGRQSINKMFTSTLNHSLLTLSWFLCFHSRNVGSCLICTSLLYILLTHRLYSPSPQGPTFPSLKK